MEKGNTYHVNKEMEEEEWMSWICLLKKMAEQAAKNNYKWHPEVFVTLKNFNSVVQGVLIIEENEINRDKVSINLSMQPNKKIICDKSNVADVMITFGVKYHIDVESYEKIIT